MISTYSSQTRIGKTDESSHGETSVPPNVKFEIDNVELDWVGHEPYQFIHLRYGAFSFRNFANLASECYQNTIPGGWCEFQDFDLEFRSPDNTMDENSSVATWIKELSRACRYTGYEPSPGPKLEGWLRDAGFQDIQTRRHELPIGDWHVDRELVGLLESLFGIIFNVHDAREREGDEYVLCSSELHCL